VAANEYHFVTLWRVRGRLEEAAAVLKDPLDLPRWWPAVYLRVRAAGEKTYELHTRGRLPYTLRWSFRETWRDYPHGFGLEAWGDFVGRGDWRLEQDGAFVNLTYDWRIRAEKPLLRWLSPLLKPLFAANHRWAMAQGERSLARELARRAAAGQREKR
jgi:hypothetical protein